VILNLNNCISEAYKSNSQKIRVLSENWVGNYSYCPACGNHLSNYQNNNPASDFYCSACSEDYELKSQKTLTTKIVDGAYNTMIEKLNSNQNPNLFILNYDSDNFDILNFLIIPKHFFTSEIIEKRNALSQNARRAGWIGCNINLKGIPESGKIFLIKNKILENKDNVIKTFNKTDFLRKQKMELRGWTLDIMLCIDKLGKKEFTLSEVYNFEEQLRLKHPENTFIKDKIRQQLQILRDYGYLEFIGRGKYKLV